MKINEIIVEVNLKSYAKQPIRDLSNIYKNFTAGATGQRLQPGRNVKGQFAKTGAVARTGHTVGQGIATAGKAVAPVMPAATQYTKDIASAIRTGASGGSYTQGATATQYDRAPIGYTIVDQNKQQWKKSAQGWVNVSSNRMASTKEAEILDRFYTKQQSQLPIAQQTGLAKAPNMSAQVPLPKAQIQQQTNVRKAAE